MYAAGPSVKGLGREREEGPGTSHSPPSYSVRTGQEEIKTRHKLTWMFQITRGLVDH